MTVSDRSMLGQGTEKQRLLQAVQTVVLDSPRRCDLIMSHNSYLFKPCKEALRTMTIDPELSRQLLTLLSDHDNPASVSTAIDLILSVYPNRVTEDLIFHLQCVDETGRVVPHEKTGLPTTIIKADWLAV